MMTEPSIESTNDQIKIKQNNLMGNHDVKNEIKRDSVQMKSV